MNRSALMSVGISCALLAASTATAANVPLPVIFMEPTVLELGSPPLASSSSWDMQWDFNNSGALTPKLRGTCVCTPGFSSALIVPSTTGHAINTKGTGATNGRFMFTFEPIDAAEPMAVVKTKTKSNQSNDRTIQVEISVGNDNGVDNTLFILSINMTSPRGWEIHGDPHVDIGDDWRSIEIQSNFFPPDVDLSDPNLPDVVFSLSAVAVPAPGTAALLGLGGLVGARRRR